MTVMDRTVVDLFDQQAREFATANPPGKAALTVLAFIITAIGWVIGRSWWSIAHVLRFTFLSFRYGYRMGAKVPLEARPAPA